MRFALLSLVALYGAVTQAATHAVTPEDVAQAQAIPRCSPALAVDTTRLEGRAARFAEAFRRERRAGRKIAVSQVSFDGTVREATPSYVHLEAGPPTNNRSLCLDYDDIGTLQHDLNGQVVVQLRLEARQRLFGK
jgi:hypothetical protein